MNTNDILQFYSNAKEPYYKLSNFYSVNIEYDNLTYPSLEHAYVAQFVELKTREKFTINGKYSDKNDKKYTDMFKRKKMIGILAKKYRKNEEIKFSMDIEDKTKLMYKLLKIKYQDQELCKLLISTDNKYLLEFGRNADKNSYWNGKVKNNEIIGKNTLGILLMKLRKKIEKNEKSKEKIMDKSSVITFEINGPINKNNKILACLDFDGTIVKPKESRPFPKDAQDWQWLRPNVPKNIKKLYEDGYSIYIFTNQTKEWKIDMIKESLKTLNIPIKVIIGFGKGDFVIKKPNKKLFFDNVKESVALNFSKKSFYVGDAYDASIHFSDSDKKFAENIGMKFKIPEDIFPIELTKKKDTKNYEKDYQEIVIFVGPPASGKSSFARKKLKSYQILNGDELKTLPKMISVAKKYLDESYSVVFDATNPKPENRAKIIELGKEYGIPVRCFVFNVEIEQAMEWNTLRFNETGKKIPRIAFYIFRKNYIKPTKEEGCKVINIDN
jgi:bifunctional polynucleotide phosphatase/kinase